jgi:flagellar secretion chaperone FliS
MAHARLGTYEAVGTLTADPARLVLMLFDGAARFLRYARAALDRNDLKEFAQAMSRAHAIIAELAGSLKEDQGGDVTKNLASVYRFALLHLTEGQLAKSSAHIDRVLGLLQTLREGFQGAIESDDRATTS